MIYQIVSKNLKSLINSYEFAIGDPLPSEKQLAARFSVSRMTLRKAIDDLVKEGLICRKHGQGNFILAKNIQYESQTLSSFAEHMQRLGKQAETKVTEFQVINAPLLIAQKLNLVANEKIYFIQRVRYIDNKPRKVEDSYIPVKRFPTLSIQDMETSKFAFIEQQTSLNIHGSYWHFRPVIADKKMANLLQILEGELLQQILSLTSLSDGSYVDYSVGTYCLDEYQVSYFMPRHK